MSQLAKGVLPLTDAERKWIAKLESVLKAQPERLLLVESGDSIMVVDREAAAHVDLWDGRAEKNGVFALAYLSRPSFQQFRHDSYPAYPNT